MLLGSLNYAKLCFEIPNYEKYYAKGKNGFLRHDFNIKLTKCLISMVFMSILTKTLFCCSKY